MKFMAKNNIEPRCLNIDALITVTDIVLEIEAENNPTLIPLRREADNSIYAWKCPECEGFWKVYQNQYHNKGCSEKHAVVLSQN